MPQKPVQIPLSTICPTEFLIPQDKLDEIATHYNGTIESIHPIVGYKVGKKFYVENGNKRSLFLLTQGHEYILGYPQPYDEDEISDLSNLVQKAQRQGVYTLADLSSKIVSRAQYTKITSRTDWLD